MNAHIPPHDEFAEVSVLGSMLLSAKAITDVAEALAPEDFYVPKHQWIYEAATHVRQAGDPVDAVTLADELGRRGQLDRVGGAPYLLTLVQRVPVASNAAYYASIVAARATLRRLIEAGTRVVQLGYAGADGADVDEVVERARAELDKLTGNATVGDTFELGNMIPDHLDALREAKKPGFETGFIDLDKILNGGLHPGNFVVIGARPGVGKSLLGLRFAAHVAAAGHGALMVSLEMSRAELMNRFFAAEAKVELTALNAHRLSDDDWTRLSKAAEESREWPLAVTDAPRIGVTGIMSRARDRSRTARGLALVVVDYLQLVQPPDARATREQQVAAISRSLKLMSRELMVPVVVAAQLNRGSEQRAERRPVLSDLRESGQIEADADTVLLLHDDAELAKSGQIEVIVAKNRHGPKGTIQLTWAPYYATARNAARSFEEAS